MEKTPVSKSKFSYLLKSNENKTVDEESPQISCTQERSDVVDVVWDWNSPRVQQPKRSQKRLMLSQSPKPTFKRHPSNNTQDFEKLRQELQALQEAIAVPDNEDSLRLSPVEEAAFKDVEDTEMFMEEAIPSQEYNNFFNDSLDEDLLTFSRQLETKIQNKEPSTSNLQKCVENNVNSVNYSGISRTVEKSPVKLQRTKENANIPNDSFNSFVRDFNTNQQSAKPADNIIISNFVRTRSDNLCRQDNVKAKVEFHRTQSFEMSRIEEAVVLPKDKLQEIERKRLEAIAKLESKRKQENVSVVTSPVKCSFEEIERKRLEALAKREAKRQQEFIERKRQEALKKLEIRRKKNATVVKSSLTNRLN